jgi:hypothetical protein
MNFDAEMVGPFLARVSSLNMGFGPTQIAIVLETVDALQVNEERELRFEIVENGRIDAMAIRVLKDDVDALMLCFLAPPKIAHDINRQMETFCEEYGL